MQARFTCGVYLGTGVSWKRFASFRPLTPSTTKATKIRQPVIQVPGVRLGLPSQQPAQDLPSDYTAVRDNTAVIYDRVIRSAGDSLLMPPLPRGPWSPDLVDLFQEWLVGGMPA